jgi:hypothetical protein
MATNIETMYVADQPQLQATVQRLVSQGGVVQGQTDDSVQVYVKRKLNIVVLVVGLILCLVPGLAYLIWYLTADQNQQITVQIGQPGSINTNHDHWYQSEAVDGAVPGSVPPPVEAAPAAPGAVTPPAATAPLPPAPPPPAAAPGDPGAPPPVV